MSFNEIKELRQSGKLESALTMALSEFEQAQNLLSEKKSELTAIEIAGLETSVLWAKRALAWVYYDYLKTSFSTNNTPQFLQYLTSIKDLKLPVEEQMIFDNCGWQIGSLIFMLAKEQNINFHVIDQIFECIQGFHFSKPSESYSFLYKAFHKVYPTWSNYLVFADWWGFEHFLQEDYEQDKFKERKIMAIVEQAYIAYSKKLLEAYANGVSVDQQIKTFLPKLGDLEETRSDYQYPAYFKAKLLLTTGSKENALQAFLPFAKQKRNDFWMWELLGEIFEDQDAKKFSCLCKALSLKTPEDFLVKLRQTFSRILVDRGLYQEAKTEILKILSTREKHDWSIPYEVKNWVVQPWYTEATGKTDNKSFYLKNIQIAESILFMDVPEETILVEFVNENKSMLNFIKNKQKYGFFNYSGLIKKPEVGDLLKVRFNGEGKDGFYKILTAEKTDSGNNEVYKKFSGDIRIPEGQSFGFVEDVFIEPQVVTLHQIKNKQRVNGQAMLSFNKRKNEWGWKMFKLID